MALANIVVARRLGPEALGVVGLTQLWLLYAGLCRPGILQAAYRETLHLLGEGKDEEARHISHVAQTAERLFLVVPLLALAAYAVRHPSLRLPVALTALSFVANSLYQFTDTMQWAHQRFSAIFRANFIIRVAQPLLIAAGAFYLGLYGVLLGPTLASIAALIFYGYIKGIDFRPAWDTVELRRLFRIGLPLSLVGVLYWGFRACDRAMVAAWLPLEHLGLFTFAMLFINQGCQFISDFLNVLQANLLSEIGREGNLKPFVHQIERISLLIVATTAVGSGLAQTAFHPFVANFTPSFLDGVGVFDVLSLNLMCLTAPLLPFMILTSSLVNRQNTYLLVQASGIVINVALGALFVTRWDLIGIAWSSVLSQLTITVVGFALLHPYLFKNAPIEKAVRFYSWLIFLLTIGLGQHALMQIGPFRYAPDTPWHAAAASRLAFLALLWLGILSYIYKRWWGDTDPPGLPTRFTQEPVAS